MWRAFWGNAGSPDAKKASQNQKLKLLERAVVSVASYRWSRWPPQKSIANELDRIQTKMFAIVLNVRPRPGEDLFKWNRRRFKHAASFVKSRLWSYRWFDRALRWDEHIERHPEFFVSCLRSWRGREWLIERRAENMPILARVASRLSIHAGLTRTRASAGCVQKRWHDGVDYARQTLASEYFLCGTRYRSWLSLPQICAARPTHEGGS